MKTDRQNAQQQKREAQPFSVPATSAPERNYHAFLLRCWAETVAETVTWRFSLEAIPGGERTGFANLADLLAFLNGQTKP